MPTVNRKLPENSKSEVQSVLFDRKKWTIFLIMILTIFLGVLLISAAQADYWTASWAIRPLYRYYCPGGGGSAGRLCYREALHPG